MGQLDKRLPQKRWKTRKTPSYPLTSPCTTQMCVYAGITTHTIRFLNYFIMLLQYIFEWGPNISILASNFKDEWLDHVLSNTALIFHDVGFVVSVVGGRKDADELPPHDQSQPGLQGSQSHPEQLGQKGHMILKFQRCGLCLASTTALGKVDIRLLCDQI